MRTAISKLPIVVLDIDGDCVAFYADAKRREYRAVEDMTMYFREDEIDAPMAHVIEHSSVIVH